MQFLLIIIRGRNGFDGGELRSRSRVEGSATS